MEGAYILVVDDESRMRKLLKDFLSAKGYKILEAEDGEKALQSAAHHRDRCGRAGAAGCPVGADRQKALCAL